MATGAGVTTGWLSRRYTATGARLSDEQRTAMESFYAALECDERLPLITHKAYALATVRHECAGTWRPILELGNAAHFARYEGGLAHALGNTEPGDGYRFRGRGFVQITGRVNYRRLGGRLDLDLESNPDQALDPVIAYRILSLGMSEGLFTGAPLDRYLTPGSTDYVNARRVINGLDCAERVAGYAREFERILSE